MSSPQSSSNWRPGSPSVSSFGMSSFASPSSVGLPAGVGGSDDMSSYVSSYKPEPLSEERIKELSESMFQILPMEEKRDVFARVNVSTRDGLTYAEALELLSKRMTEEYSKKSEVTKYVQQPLSQEKIEQYVSLYFSSIASQAQLTLGKVGPNLSEGEALKHLREEMDSWRSTHVFDVTITNTENGKSVTERLNGEDKDSSLSWIDDRIPEITPGIYLRAVALVDMSNHKRIPFHNHKVSWELLRPNGEYTVELQDTRNSIYKVGALSQEQKSFIALKWKEFEDEDLVEVSVLEKYLEAWLTRKLDNADKVFRNEQGEYDTKTNEEAHKHFVQSFENSVSDKRKFLKECDSYDRGKLNYREFQLFCCYLRIWEME